MTDVPLLAFNNGRTIPQIGLGTYKIYDPASLYIGYQAGYRHFDTAQNYGNEAALGRAIRAGMPRESIFVTTKLSGGNQSRALAAFDASLEALQLDYVDMFLIHWPQPMYDEYVGAWRALESIYASGRALTIGVSNFTIPLLQRLFSETSVVPAINQVELHPGFDQAELRAFHAQHGILTEAWSPLGEGRALMVDPLIVSIAHEIKRTPAQVVLRWHVQLGNVVIPKASTPAHMAENIDVFDFELSNVQMAALSTVTCPRIGAHPDNYADR